MSFKLYREISVSNLHGVDDYYNPKFQFCEPEGGPKKQSESLGGILFGDRIFNSPFDVRKNSVLTTSLLTRVTDQNAGEQSDVSDAM